MLLVNTVLTLPHVRYAVARAYVDYIFVIIFSAKIYESYILSISLTYNLRIRTCAERSERGSWKTRLLISSAKLLYLLLASARNASYCELATLNLHMLTYICVGLRKIKVSDGFRKFQMVSDGVGFQVSGFRCFIQTNHETSHQSR